ncbi:sigma-E factor negative regulatory protein [Undibacterium sp. Jales W-56]|uniref:sigma-E factor negative regulatory protein n=1 Tax=Undibacterium sp. Jales W-56 TaxID=2897325 RepID=UPI0021D0909C|nr:sigma-E factor negative regulatory protein [Undibacterium sp. Jales W-56]MCU6433649.1 sigma-E factor negative regulatory protein [Undibacterium sp. Jales W-56]
MNIDHTKNAGISALLDNELSDAQLDAVLASLSADADERQAWDMYHQIGDVLRSDDLAINLSPGFAAKMNALLDAEPVILAPQRVINRTPGGEKSHFARYTAMLSVAAMAVLAFMLVPQIAPYINGNGAATMQMSKTSDTQSNPVQLVADAGTAPAAESKNKAPDEIEMLRDPRLDSYLQAHQKFSPSIANASQFANHTTVNAVGNTAAPAASASSASFAPEK